MSHWAILGASVLHLLGSVIQTRSPEKEADSHSTVGVGSVDYFKSSVALLTVSPGDRVYEYFGHTALWIRDARRGVDRVYDFGRFNPHEPGFLWRFVEGVPRYSMERDDGTLWIDAYRKRGRNIQVQELLLDSLQQSTILNALVALDSDETRYYRYDGFVDNCSTRPRDILDNALGGLLRTQLTPRLSPFTFRSAVLDHTTPSVTVSLGLTIALGKGADSRLSWWDAAFLPRQLAEALSSVRVPTKDNVPTPLIRSTYTLASFTGSPVMHTRRLGLGSWVVVGLALLSATIVVAWAKPKWGMIIAYAWLSLLGVVGVVLMFFVTATNHTLAGNNENLLLFNPFIVILLLLSLASWRNGSPATKRIEKLCAILTELGMIAALGMKLAPEHQANSDLIAGFLPLSVASLALLYQKRGLRGNEWVRSADFKWQ